MTVSNKLLELCRNRRDFGFAPPAPSLPRYGCRPISSIEHPEAVNSVQNALRSGLAHRLCSHLLALIVSNCSGRAAADVKRSTSRWRKIAAPIGQALFAVLATCRPPDFCRTFGDTSLRNWLDIYKESRSPDCWLAWCGRLCD